VLAFPVQLGGIWCAVLFRSTPRRFGWSLLLVALCVRMLAVWVLRDPTQFHGFEMGQDGYHYDELARSLLAGDGYELAGEPSAFRAPGFPLFLALVYALSAKSYFAAYFSLCLLGSLAVYWTYRAGCLLADERTGRIAAVLLALYPPHIYFATLFASENLFVTLLALALFLGAQSELRRGTLLAGLGLGLCLGFLILTRPFAILALPLLFLPLLLWRTQRGRVQLLRAAGLGAGMALCLIPWGLRNQAQLGEFVLLSTGGGPTFRGSYNDRVLEEERFHGGWVAADQLPDWERLRAVQSELERNRLQMQWGREWILAHWQDLPRMLWWRFARFWMPDRDSENRSYVLLQWAGTSPFLILIGIGIVWRVRQRPYGRQWWLADSLMLACLATGLMFWGAPRFRDGNAPILMLYAALPLAALLRRFSPPDSDGEPGASNSASTRAGSARVPPP
jgi:4-amino-4-deoxy-L-arabinose transferase-like glycosyltransferase